MKPIFFLVFLFISSFLNAQQISDTNKKVIQGMSTNESINFIVPDYTNSILDAENYFSETELEQLNKLIDSIYQTTKLKFQLAFVTPNYYQSDLIKFDEFVDLLTNKWKLDENTSRVMLVVSMQQRQAQIKLFGNKLNKNIRKFIDILKEKRAATALEQDNIENFSKIMNGVLGESHLGVNLKSKNYVQAVKEFLNVVVKKSNLFYDLD